VPVAAVKLFWPTPAVRWFRPRLLLAVASSNPPHRSADDADIVNVTVSLVVNCVRMTDRHSEIVDPSVALALDCECSATFVQTFPCVSETDEWLVVAPSVALMDADAKHATATRFTTMVPVTVMAMVLALVARLVSPRTVTAESAMSAYRQRRAAASISSSWRSHGMQAPLSQGIQIGPPHFAQYAPGSSRNPWGAWSSGTR
jgi:hypothetical protein